LEILLRADSRRLIAMANLYIALLHYPVYNKEGRVVVTSVTNMDVHDIARTARTYSVKGYYIVTPVEKQRDLVISIIDHWRKGYGAVYNPRRKEAFETVSVGETLDSVVQEISEREGQSPRIVATSADSRGPSLGFEELRDKLRTGNEPYIILFGTGWGMGQDVIARADFLLEPIRGCGDYNHLPVRSAVAITLDRLAGTR